LQFLYRIDFLGISSGDSKKSEILSKLKNDLETFWAGTDEKDPEVRAFAEDLIVGSITNLEEIDTLIQKAAEKWRLLRMASIDRNILRFSTYELLYRKDIPDAVTINEAIEISKKYSTLESASFINGILDKISKEHTAP